MSDKDKHAAHVEVLGMASDAYKKIAELQAENATQAEYLLNGDKRFTELESENASLQAQLKECELVIIEAERHHQGNKSEIGILLRKHIPAPEVKGECDHVWVDANGNPYGIAHHCVKCDAARCELMGGE